MIDDHGQVHRDAIAENVDNHSRLIRAGARHWRSKIYVLPEFSLHGFGGGIPVERWIEASCRVPGPETEQMGKVAKDVGAYIAFMVYEYMEDWPGRYWNTAVIVSPEGEVVHRYRKLYAQTTKTRPGDVYTEYVERMGGPESLFPVLETPFGRIGTMICYDMNFPEVARCLALRGAEILLHITSEARAPWRGEQGGWTHARLTRAYENVAYLAMANTGPITGGDLPDDVCTGRSQIIDFNGRVIDVAQTSNETMLTCEIDIDALRRRRTRPYLDPHSSGMNFLAELNTAIHAPIYQKYSTWPADHWADQPMQRGEENFELVNQVIETQLKEGRLVPPES